jgi:hypothetical protein
MPWISMSLDPATMDTTTDAEVLTAMTYAGVLEQPSMDRILTDMLRDNGMEKWLPATTAPATPQQLFWGVPL